MPARHVDADAPQRRDALAEDEAGRVAIAPRRLALARMEGADAARRQAQRGAHRRRQRRGRGAQLRRRPPAAIAGVSATPSKRSVYSMSGAVAAAAHGVDDRSRHRLRPPRIGGAHRRAGARRHARSRASPVRRIGTRRRSSAARHQDPRDAGQIRFDVDVGEARAAAASARTAPSCPRPISIDQPAAGSQARRRRREQTADDGQAVAAGDQRGAAARRRARASQRIAGLQYGGLLTITSKRGVGVDRVEQVARDERDAARRRRARPRCAPPRRARRRETSTRRRSAPPAARARARRRCSRCRCRRRRPRSTPGAASRSPVQRASIRQAISTSSSVSGRGISTAGRDGERQRPELLHAGDVGDRLAAGAALDERGEALLDVRRCRRRGRRA